ncbi:nitroreductase family deazaflavin-dependent oxidoreductase [Nocardia sp. NPDC050717]|uniref:nitroreductase family deazaflavin-dependent oxidoreductase n=1 Tax=Nocardia sp. NPDC050717 TaxID=3157221 RepID=UPI00340764BF
MADLLTGLSARALRTRWLVRAPIGLYRAGLGFLCGRRLLMLEHLGRRSGARRYVVLEVVERPAPDQFVIVSGFGTGAQWYRNVVADPHVRVSWWVQRLMPALATPMTSDESARALARYAEAHPRAWDKLRATIEQATGAPVRTLPMVRLRLCSGLD